MSFSPLTTLIKLNVDITQDDKLLLCTDGLSNYATEEKILQIINGNVLDKVSNLLIDEANNGGGRDNITVAVISH